MMVANTRMQSLSVYAIFSMKVLSLAINLESHIRSTYPLVFENRRGDEARIKKNLVLTRLVPHALGFLLLSLYLVFKSMPSADMECLTTHSLTLEYVVNESTLVNWDYRHHRLYLPDPRFWLVHRIDSNLINLNDFQNVVKLDVVGCSFGFFDIQNLLALSPRTVSSQECFPSIKSSGMIKFSYICEASENAVSSSQKSFGYQKPLGSGSLIVSSYQALGACFNPSKLSQKGRLLLDCFDQQNPLAEQHKLLLQWTIMNLRFSTSI
ncbi:hypothetical protein Tco_0594822 [Tanacetum coccineum]